MLEITGMTASAGLAVGKALVIRHTVCKTDGRQAEDPDEELQHIEEARQTASAQLSRLSDGEGEAAQVFAIHQMLLEDADLTDFLHEAIAQRGLTAQQAVQQAADTFCALFEQTGDEYMRARAADIRDVCDRLLRCLNKKAEQPLFDGQPFVALTDELLPGDLITYGRENLLGIVMREGSINAHVCILARSWGIPVIIHAPVELSQAYNGKTVIVDATNARLLFEPDEKALSLAQRTAQMQDREPLTRPQSLPFSLCVSISEPAQADAQLLQLSDGIGLFRTEFLYMGRTGLPDESEQLAAFQTVLQAAGGKPVVIRTFDLGADKQAAALPIRTKDNPALGCRGIRVYYDYPEVFKTQLRALLRASVFGDIRILYPMITAPQEVIFAKDMVQLAAKELTEEKLPFRIPPQGIMLETPAAVLLSTELAQEADFFSVGTNDLTQYTLAIDRQDGSCDRFYDRHHTAVLRLLRMAAHSAHRAGIPIGICGELAAEAALAPEFQNIGIDSLSVSGAAFRELLQRYSDGNADRQTKPNQQNGRNE